MKTFRTSIAATLSCLGIALCVSAVAAANDANEPRSVTVQYSDLDITSHLGAVTLYGRLRSAARSVCTPFEGRELQRRALWNACYNQALSNAVIQVNRESVTALHQHALHGDRPS